MKWVFTFLFFCYSFSNAQNSDTSSVQIPSSNTVIPQKSPMNAVAYSFLFPGLGQMYVESYWKAPLIAGAAGFFVYQIIHNHTLYTEKLQQYNDAIAAGKSPILPEVNLVKRQKEYYNNNRDLNALWLLGVYGIAAVDAYVGAHLFEFDVSDNLSLRILPDPINNAGLVSARIQF